eukprot:364783-Chlamydomonas_euryale.AAC.11
MPSRSQLTLAPAAPPRPPPQCPAAAAAAPVATSCAHFWVPPRLWRRPAPQPVSVRARGTLRRRRESPCAACAPPPTHRTPCADPAAT